MRLINRGKIQEIRARLSLLNVCVTGYWFCTSCQHVTESEERRDNFVCAICGRTTIKWNPPLFSEEEHQRLRQEQREWREARQSVSRGTCPTWDTQQIYVQRNNT